MNYSCDNCKCQQCNENFYNCAGVTCMQCVDCDGCCNHVEECSAFYDMNYEKQIEE